VFGELHFRQGRHVLHGIGMRERPAVGEEARHEVRVEPEMTARLFDREVHPVYATAWMVRHVEEAARLLIQPHLGPDEDATGYEIRLRHERPAMVGDLLQLVATATEVDDRACVSDVVVTGPRGVVGRATFVQRYVPRGHLHRERESE
jgi:predicted thioesterase